ncbi:MAG: OmpA family protein [Phycisphaeraceae bacterium]
MKFRLTWTLALAAIAFISVGCVSQRELDETQSLYRQSQEQVVELRQQLADAQETIDALRQRLETGADVEAELGELQAERDRLAQALSAAEQRLEEAAVGPELPEELSAELAELAQAHPELLSYDPDLGMVKFQSDFTFALGSAELRSEAEQTLGRLAEILQGSAAQPYVVRIVGHTDAVPIQNPATREKHPTNWHLSVHRAIAVEQALEDAGVKPERMNVSGYGPYRPIVPNEPGGAQANRRVELYLLTETAPQFTEQGDEADVPDQSDQSAEPAENPAMFK